MPYSMMSQEMLTQKKYKSKSVSSITHKKVSSEKHSFKKPWAWLFWMESINEVDGIVKYAMGTQYLKSN